MREEILSLAVQPDTTIAETMKRISQAGKLELPGGIAVIVDNKTRLLGIVTDGDIRRAIVNKAALNKKISTIMNTAPVVFPSGSSYEQILRRISALAKSKKAFIEKVILVDKTGRLEEVLDFHYLRQFQNIKTLKIAVVGMGYIGLPLAVSLAESGFKTYGIEKNTKIVRRIKKGIPHFYEKGLKPLLQHQIKAGSLKMLSSLDKADAQVYIICVGIPLDSKKNPHYANLHRAARSIGRKLKPNDIVILRSTVPVQATRNYLLPMLEKESGLAGGREFFLAYAPERAVEGKVLEEIRSIPQIIAGLNNRSLERAVNILRNICDSVISVNTLEEAELIKLINNCYRDYVFSFSNEFALLCERLNIDAAKCIKDASSGYLRGNIPLPSPGVGGMCLSKDPYLYAHSLRKMGFVNRGALHSRRINEFIPGYLADKIVATLRGMKKKVSGVKLFIIGFTFKGFPETSDTRDSSTLRLISALKNRVKSISGYDPMLKKAELRKLGVAPSSLREGFKDSDAVIIMNNNPVHSEIEISKYFSKMRKPSLFCDFWGIFPSNEITKLGDITYMGMGFIKGPDDEKANK